MNRSTMNTMSLKQYRQLKKQLKRAQTGQENKYNNRKVVILGENFDSQKEADRWAQLKLMERAGSITDLQRQVKFVLIPAQREVIRLKNGDIKSGKVIEKEASYKADFVYTDTATGERVVEDVKSEITSKNQTYVLKRKLMLQVYGIRVHEI